MRFVEACDQLRILLLILPPHSTHWLQPLDVGLFSPLSTSYSKQLNQLVSNSFGLIGMSKRVFWRLFWPAWKEAFRPDNIESAWKKTGLFPLRPGAVLNVITKLEPPAAVSASLKTPISSRAVRRAHRQYKIEPTKLLMSKILRANERLAAHHDIDLHVIERLKMDIKQERKRRKRGKRLNLCGEQDSGPQFYGPEEVKAAQDYQASKEVEEEQRKQEIIDKKEQAAAKRVQKEKERVERAAITAAKRKAAAEARAIREEEKRAWAGAKAEALRQKKEQLRLWGQSTGSKEARKTPKKQARKSVPVVIEQEEEVAVMATSRGRQVQKPQRFRA